MLLDRRQPADGADHLGIGGELEIAARARGSRIVIDRGKLAEVEAERHDAVLIGAADAEAVSQLALDRRRDGDDDIAEAGEHALERDEQSRHQRAEISLEHVAVIGVDDARARRAAARQVVGRGRDAAEQAGLGHVRVHDRRPRAFRISPIEAQHRRADRPAATAGGTASRGRSRARRARSGSSCRLRPRRAGRESAWW